MPSRKKSWQTGRQRVSVEAALAIQRENVMQRLVRLRHEIGHPDKPGEPLPQDQAAQRAGVTARQWQRWENGVSVPYARNLSAVADAYGFDVGEFYDGPAGQIPAATPDPFASTDGSIEERLAELTEQLAADREDRAASVAELKGLLDTQNRNLARQSLILEGIEKLLATQESAARHLDEAAQQIVREQGGTALEAEPPPPAAKRTRTAKSRTPPASRQDPA